MYSLGVDLGTTFVAAAVARADQLEMVTLGDRSVSTPAVVYLREDGTMITGDAAQRRAVSNPDRVAREFKRHLGDPTPIRLAGTSQPASALLGALLGDVLDKVTETEGRKPDQVVLTHPANWGPFRRGLFEEVPSIAGLDNPPTVTEPTAAAAHYAASHELRDGETVAVYDLGGGTFDATVLRARDGGVEILGTPEGIERLGGVDFDEAIVSHVNHTSGGALDDLDPRDPQTVVALARLRQDCILAKEALSVDTETVVPVFLPGRHFDVELSRAQFEDMIRAPVESTIGALGRTLRSAHVDPSDLSAVLLVGGSSRIPLVAEMVSAELSRPTLVDTHPKYAVALGAAILAGLPEIPSGVASSASTARRRPGPITANPTGAPVTGPPSGAMPAVAAAGASTLAPPSPGPASGTVPGGRGPSTSAPAPSTGTDDESAATGLVPATGGGSRPDTGRSRVPGPAPGGEHADRGPGAGPAAPGWSDDMLDAPTGPLPIPAQPSPPPAPPGQPGSATSPPPPSDRPGLRRALAAVGMVVALVAVVGLGYYGVRALMGSSAPSGTPGTTNTAALAPPPPPAQIAASVPIPTLGATIAVGPTPGFAAVSPNGRLVYTADRDAKTITAVDTSANAVIATIPVPAGPPQYLAFAPDGKHVYVSVFDEAKTIHAVAVLDTTTNEIVATIPVRTRPFLAAVSNDGSRLWVPNHDSGTVSVIDTATNQMIREVAVSPNPHWVEFSRDGTKAYTANHESNVVDVIDTATFRTLAQVPVGTSPHSVAVHPTRPLVANTNYDADSVSMIDTNTNAVTATIPVGHKPQEITWSADGRFAYVANNTGNTVSVIDARTMTVTATLPTPPAPSSIAVTPDGRTAYVSCTDAGVLQILNLAG